MRHRRDRETRHVARQLYSTIDAVVHTVFATPIYFDKISLSHPLSKIKENILEPPPSCKPHPTTFAYLSAKPLRAAYTSEYGTHIIRHWV